MLVLTNPVSSKTTHRGDEIQAQTTAPIAVGDHVVIPAGVFVQGTVDKLTRNGSRGEMLMESVKVIFPDGYVANITGPITIESEEGTAWRAPSGGAASGAFIAPFAGLGVGALIGNAAHTTDSSSLGAMTITHSSPKGIAIGTTVGMAVGAVVAIAILAHSRQFFVEVGAPMEMTLPQPVTLSQTQVQDAVREAQEHPVAVPMPSPRPLPAPPQENTDHGTCFTPGTPDTVIPGMPASDTSPGTPSTVIPGTPATPATSYPPATRCG
jgi:type IV secretion system protein VirB10